jgi:hypothetical protein
LIGLIVDKSGRKANGVGNAVIGTCVPKVVMGSQACVGVSDVRNATGQGLRTIRAVQIGTWLVETIPVMF